MSGTSAGWTPERRAAQAARMTALNTTVLTKARRSAGWTEARRMAKSAELKARNLDPAFQAKRRIGVAKGPDDVAERHVHPLVRGLFLEMKKQRASCERIAAPAGVCRTTVVSWRRHHMPQLDALDAALNVLGFELAIVPKGRRGPNGFTTRKSSTGE
ncbi:hypothetical protein [Bradyrhizobium sp. 191]|uniref:hypothetical protein n=1 Tax=Bradyrhizobium sp. 191 TaxID=2782659 RepID=UPI00200005E4|nr:hypothetical protein [Bradyrhizobium sp. 191]UPJ65267.1 hypothetical protein IVB23_35985 [Bradyrhizobium sp. 191]